MHLKTTANAIPTQNTECSYYTISTIWIHEQYMQLYAQAEILVGFCRPHKNTQATICFSLAYIL